MKKLFSVLAVLFVLGTTSSFAKVAIGAQGGYPLGGAVTFKIDAAPCVFAANFAMNNDVMAVGVTADWWMANPKIEGMWGYYYGLGVYGGAVLGDTVLFQMAPRVLVGTNVFVLDRLLELYVQAAWEPTITFGDSVTVDWTAFSANAGFRFWF